MRCRRLFFRLRLFARLACPAGFLRFFRLAGFFRLLCRTVFWRFFRFVGFCRLFFFFLMDKREGRLITDKPSFLIIFDQAVSRTSFC